VAGGDPRFYEVWEKTAGRRLARAASALALLGLTSLLLVIWTWELLSGRLEMRDRIFDAIGIFGGSVWGAASAVYLVDELRPSRVHRGRVDALKITLRGRTAVPVHLLESSERTFEIHRRAYGRLHAGQEIVIVENGNGVLRISVAD
jgi:hypothetical protein